MMKTTSILRISIVLMVIDDDHHELGVLKGGARRIIPLQC